MHSRTDAAIVLAGYGLPVAPFDLEQMRIIAKPSRDIDTALRLFASWEAAPVGHSVCAAPLYVLLTDCIRTVHERLAVEATLAQIKHLFARAGQIVSAESAPPFTPAMGLFRSTKWPTRDRSCRRLVGCRAESLAALQTADALLFPPCFSAPS
jgi:hypothetical protein